MAETTEADRYLLDGIGKGDPDAWGQLVDRYQGRLLAFARARLGRKADAEDLVQEAFTAFLQSFRTLRPGCSVETYLFMLLRRRLIDVFRGRGTGGLRVCSIQDLVRGRGEDADGELTLPGSEPTASWYARRDEHAGRLADVLGGAVDALVTRLKDAQNLRDLRVVEMLFYAQLRNKEVAALCGLEETQIALIKHRCLKEVRTHVAARLDAAPAGPDDAADGFDPGESLLTEVWERRRPTCPKRSTLGRYLLGTLEPPWHGYVDFHATELGCRFCQANLDDLRRQDAEQPRALRERIFHSTIGFLSRPGG